jgi:hypothetical protein
MAKRCEAFESKISGVANDRVCSQRMDVEAMVMLNAEWVERVWTRGHSPEDYSVRGRKGGVKR